MNESHLLRYCHALWSKGSFVDKTTGMVWNSDKESDIPQEQRLDTPLYSHAHVRQQFLKDKGIPGSKLDEYGLSGYPDFPLEHDDTLDECASDYITKAHWQCEDLQIEDEFWVFNDEYSIPLAIRWCQENNILSRVMFAPGFSADDSKALNDTLTKTHDLQELKSFFGALPPKEASLYDLVDDEKELSIYAVHKRFPIECLRQEDYCVYHVKQGGYFYVCWGERLRSMQYLFANVGRTMDESDHDQTWVFFTAYLSNLKNAKDFDLIQEGISTAEDVSQIDSSFELISALAGGIRSYSLLDDGTMMAVWYHEAPNVNSRKELLVKSKKVIQKGPYVLSCLASILPKDLP